MVKEGEMILPRRAPERMLIKTSKKCTPRAQLPSTEENATSGRCPRPKRRPRLVLAMRSTLGRCGGRQSIRNGRSVETR